MTQPRHILNSQQFDPAWLDFLFQRADDFHSRLGQPAKMRELLPIGQSQVVFTLFYEPSTRTRLSFEAAASNIGLQVVSTENAREFSSAAKGETLEDTIRVPAAYHPAAIIMRHYESGAADLAAAVSGVPIINAGDGGGQHPTQALLDLYTIRKELGQLDGLTVLIGGDLANGRTARSLVYLLSKFQNIKIIFVAPRGLEIGNDIKDYLSENKVAFREETVIDGALQEADVVYWTRIQKERLLGVKYENVAHQYILGPKQIALMKQKSIIMHPLPRVGEIEPAVDSDPRAAYFRQAGYGLPVRMALLEWVLGK